MEFDEEEFLYARENYQGFCPTCDEFTRDCTEPDATGYDCPVCDSNEVIGAEVWLMREM